MPQTTALEYEFQSFKLSDHDWDWSLELLCVETSNMQTTALTTKIASNVSQWFVETHSTIALRLSRQDVVQQNVF